MPRVASWRPIVAQTLVVRWQDCTPFDAVLAWRGLVPTAALVALLEQGFWPQWHAILGHWLAGAPDQNEVARWYLSWKSRFPQVNLTFWNMT